LSRPEPASTSGCDGSFSAEARCCAARHHPGRQAVHLTDGVCHIQVRVLLYWRTACQQSVIISQGMMQRHFVKVPMTVSLTSLYGIARNQWYRSAPGRASSCTEYTTCHLLQGLLALENPEPRTDLVKCTQQLIMAVMPST
jgi:hypothetical protein